MFSFNFFCSMDVQKVNEILERIRKMPTVSELKTAISDAVGQEAAEVAARLKALEDKIAELTAGQIVSEADRDEMLVMVRSVFTPPAVP